MTDFLASLLVAEMPRSAATAHEEKSEESQAEAYATAEAKGGLTGSMGLASIAKQHVSALSLCSTKQSVIIASSANWAAAAWVWYMKPRISS
jgi:hypothetical protein